MKAHIIGGWSEGYRHELKLRRGLVAAGFEITDDASSAQVIMTHSAGFYFLPKQPDHQLIVIINPPYWPGRSLVPRIIRHILINAPLQIRDWGFGYWLRHRFWNIAYIVISPMRHYRIWRSLGVAIHEYLRHHSRIMLIRNTGDAFCTPDLESLAKQHQNLKLAELPGRHDDLWVKPQPYIDLLLKEL